MVTFFREKKLYFGKMCLFSSSTKPVITLLATAAVISDEKTIISTANVRERKAPHENKYNKDINIKNMYYLKFVKFS